MFLCYMHVCIGTMYVHVLYFITPLVLYICICTTLISLGIGRIIEEDIYFIKPLVLYMYYSNISMHRKNNSGRYLLY